jgi:hypothetical protein
MSDVFRFLDHVDMRTLLSVAEKLKKSRSKKEQAVGAFLSRVYEYRTSVHTPEKSSQTTESKRLFDGLRDIR